MYNFCVLAIQCDALSDPANGTVSITGTGVGDTATYSCDEGYELSGSGTLTCQLNGEWSGSPPTCEGKHSIKLCTEYPGKNSYQDLVRSAEFLQELIKLHRDGFGKICCLDSSNFCYHNHLDMKNSVVKV